MTPRKLRKSFCSHRRLTFPSAPNTRKKEQKYIVFQTMDTGVHCTEMYCKNIKQVWRRFGIRRLERLKQFFFNSKQKQMRR